MRELRLLRLLRRRLALRRLPLSFSYDHRVIDGALGARIARFLADTLAQPKDLVGAMS